MRLTLEAMREQQMPGEQTPLESWKEIAAYLQKDQTTVRRWEKREGLPVHRHHHMRRASVYAYPSELDAWREGRKPSEDPEPEPEPERMALWGSPLSSFATATLLLLALISVGDAPPELFQVRGQGASSSMTTRKVWNLGNFVGPSSISADGRYMTYVDRGADWNLAVRDLTTGESRLLTNDSTPQEYAEASVIAPNGARAVFSRFTKKNNYQLRVADLRVAAPGASLLLFDDPEAMWMFPGDWSPDGKKVSVMIQRRDRTSVIGLVSVEDGSLQVLRTIGWGGAGGLIFSPDGKYLAYDTAAMDGAEQKDVFLLVADGSGETRVVQHAANDRVVGWSPDGSFLLFSSDRAGSEGLWAVAISDGGRAGDARLLKRDLKIDEGLGVTAEGTLYYMPSAILQSEVFTASFDFTTGKLLEDPRSALPEHILNNSEPQWSPDGGSLAYITRHSENRRIAVFDTGTGEVREFPSALLYIALPRWSPNGQFIAFIGDDPKRGRGLFRLDVLTGEVSALAFGNLWGSEWSSDGTKLYYRRFEQSEPSVVALDLASGTETRLFSGNAIPNISPDGTWLALRTFHQGEEGVDTIINILPVGGGEPREIFRTSQSSRSLSWAPDLASILVGIGGDPHPWQVFLDGSAPRQLDVALGNGKVSLHPDGRQIAYSLDRTVREVWALENFLPTPAE